MAKVLQIGNRTITAEEVIPLLASYHVVPQLLCESIIDQAIADIRCTPEETALACQQFYQHWQLNTEAEKQAWREQYSMSQEQLELLATRELRVEKFKQATWGHKLETYFLKRKRQLDRAVYSLIRIQDLGIANEIFFRIQEGEQTFAELAQQYSQGPEVKTGGLMGPVELGTLHPHLAQLICVSPVGELQAPVNIGEWEVIVRVEQLLPAQLDEAMRQRLLNENFQAWLQEQVSQLPERDKIWLGVSRSSQVSQTASTVAA
ncbi:MAG: peptidylprolyl isomerase [Coleofasciculaceae cyanobacterium]